MDKSDILFNYGEFLDLLRSLEYRISKHRDGEYILKTIDLLRAQLDILGDIQDLAEFQTINDI